MTNTPNQGMELLACPFCGGEVCISPARVQGEADCISHLPIVGGHRCGIDEFSNFAYDDDVAALWNTRTTPTPASSGVLVEAADEQIEEWLAANCGKGLPHGEATTEAEMLHGLAYVLRQIESTHEYKVFIGQCISATSALRMALFHFARQALSSASTDTGAREGVTRPTVAQMSEAIRKAKIKARDYLGIAWWRLEEISRAELIVEALATSTPNTDTPTDEYRRGVEDAAKVAERMYVKDAFRFEFGHDVATAIRALSPDPLGTAKERGE